jgi:hypothetical protein
LKGKLNQKWRIGLGVWDIYKSYIEMKPVISVFMDGLKPESLEYMPFLSSLPFKKRIRTVLGYSCTCLATIYTGVYPEKHLIWFFWMRNPSSSPFRDNRWVKRLEPYDSIPTRLLVRKLASKEISYTGFFGIPRIVHFPLKYWRYLDVSEKKLWNEPGYSEKYPTIFDILRREKIPFEVVGIKRGYGDESPLIREYTIERIYPWLHFFMGDVDHFSHRYGQLSKEGIERLKILDKLLQEKYREMEKKTKDFYFMVFSDHGHIEVKEKLNPFKILKGRGVNLDSIFAIVDVNYIRFWFERGEREKIERALSDLPGFILKEEHLKKYRVTMPDNRYGDLIFYLDAPRVFSRTIWGFSRSENSNHGYLPDHPDSDGVFVANFIPPGAEGEKMELVDILPIHLKLLDIQIPDYIEQK